LSLLEQMVAEWGVQCPDYDNTCSACRAWRLFRILNRVPTIDEVITEIEDEEQSLQ
jgi:hypothetical protein